MPKQKSNLDPVRTVLQNSRQTKPRAALWTRYARCIF